MLELTVPYNPPEGTAANFTTTKVISATDSTVVLNLALAMQVQHVQNIGRPGQHKF